MTTYWEIAANSAYDIFLSLSTCFHTSVLEWGFLSYCAISWSLLTFTFIVYVGLSLYNRKETEYLNLKYVDKYLLTICHVSLIIINSVCQVRPHKILKLNSSYHNLSRSCLGDTSYIGHNNSYRPLLTY